MIKKEAPNCALDYTFINTKVKKVLSELLERRPMRILEIVNCWQCYHEKNDYCDLLHRLIEYTGNTVDMDCPLPEKKNKPEPITGQLLEKLLDDFILECRKENPNLATPATYIKTIAIDRLSTVINAHFGVKEAK
jgi:hypothetical protein